MTCDICQGAKKIRLPVYGAMVASPVELEMPAEAEGYREFDCPQCVPTVPYRRVRAMKLISAYKAEEFGKYQMPIERTLAARFGEFLLREGLITFTQSGSKDFGDMADKIKVTAHLGVVSKDAIVRAGAIPEVAGTAVPRLPRAVRERAERGVVKIWNPPPVKGWDDDPVTDEFDEPKDALGARFSGLEI